MRPWLVLLPAMVASVVTGCSEEASTTAAQRAASQRTGPLRVYTTFYPTEYFCQRIAGDLVEVVCPLPEDADPVFWQPDVESLRAFQEADLIVLNGAGLEKWVEQVSLPTARVVDTAKVFRDEWLEFDNTVTHNHGPTGAHAHEGTDAHTWLDPLLAKQQAEQIWKALVARLPAEAARLGEGFAALAADLDELHVALEALGGAGKPVLASHPAYNYLARRYRWKVINLDLDPGTMPSEDAVAGLRSVVSDRGVRNLLWESSPRDEIAARLVVQLGVRSVVVSPVESLGSTERSSGQDYLSIMHANIERLKPVFQ